MGTRLLRGRSWESSLIKSFVGKPIDNIALPLFIILRLSALSYSGVGAQDIVGCCAYEECQEVVSLI